MWFYFHYFQIVRQLVGVSFPRPLPRWRIRTHSLVIVSRTDGQFVDKIGALLCAIARCWNGTGRGPRSERPLMHNLERKMFMGWAATQRHTLSMSCPLGLWSPFTSSGSCQPHKWLARGQGMHVAAHALALSFSNWCIWTHFGRQMTLTSFQPRHSDSRTGGQFLCKVEARLWAAARPIPRQRAGAQRPAHTLQLPVCAYICAEAAKVSES